MAAAAAATALEETCPHNYHHTVVPTSRTPIRHVVLVGKQPPSWSAQGADATSSQMQAPSSQVHTRRGPQSALSASHQQAAKRLRADAEAPAEGPHAPARSPQEDAQPDRRASADPPIHLHQLEACQVPEAT